MKNRWVYIPVIFSFLLLAAHFSYNNQVILLVLSLVFPLLLLLRKSWSRMLVQLALVAGAFEWAWSALDYIGVRRAIGEDYQRLAVILFSVAAFTLISGLLLYAVGMKEKA